MNIEFSHEAFKDYTLWEKTDGKKFKKINDLLKDIRERPFTGIGKPEPLKYEFQGYWSRRIDRTNRLIYKIEQDVLFVASCRYHY